MTNKFSKNQGKYWVLPILVVFLLVVPAVSFFTLETSQSTIDSGEYRLGSEKASGASESNSMNSLNRYEIQITQSFPLTDLTTGEVEGYDWLTLDGCELVDTPGEPAIPVTILNVVLPIDGRIEQFSITDYEMVTLDGEYRILPAQPAVPISEKYLHEESPIFYGANSEIYESSVPYPQNMLQALPETEFNGVTLAHFKLFPFTYWPVENKMQLHTDLKITVTVITKIEMVENNQIEDQNSFYQTLENLVENGDDIARFYPNLDEQGFIDSESTAPSGSGSRAPKPTSSKLSSRDVQYVIITNSTSYYDSFLPLAQWKTRKGMPAEIVDDGWIKSTYSGNDTQDKIRNFIRDAKSTWGTTWVLLGGDVSVIPQRGCYGAVGSRTDNNIPTDLYYSALKGSWNEDNDGIYGEVEDNVTMYADVYVGRAPVETVDEVITFVNKTLKYEKNATYGFQLEMLFIAEYLDANTDSGKSKDYIETQYVPSRFNITKLYESLSNLSKTSAVANFNLGNGITNHHAHSNSMSMGKFNSNDIKGLTNQEEQGILYSIGCYAGSFEVNDCISEEFLKNSNGGGVGVVSNSRYGWYSPGSTTGGTSNRYDQQFFNSLFKEDIYKIGHTLSDSKAFYVPWSQGLGATRWVQFCLNLLGDPEMSIWTDLPQNFSVTHPSQLYVGTQTVQVRVNDTGNSPVENALVCLQGDGVYMYGLTDINGLVDFQVTLSSSGKLNVTVTKHNFYPYEGEISKAILDIYPPIMYIGTGEFGWYSEDPGNDITVVFDSDGETDLSIAEYSLSPAGPWYTIFDTPRPVFNSPWNISMIWDSLPDGFNTISVRCNDSAAPNHWVMGNITVKKDTIAPSVSIITSSYGYYTSDPGAVFNVDFSNDSTGSPLDKAEYCINSLGGPWYTIFDSSVPNYNIDWPVKWSKLEDGTNTIYIRLFDEAGNEDSTLDSILLKRDTRPPKIVVRKDTYGWYSTDPGGVVDVDFSNGGNGSDLDYAQYRIGPSGDWKYIFISPVPDYLTNWQVDWSLLSEGENIITMRCFDKVGFMNLEGDGFSNNITILKDTTAPEIMINQHTYGWYTFDPGNIIDVDFFNGLGNSSLLDYAQYRVHPEPSLAGSGLWRNIFETDTKEFTIDWQVLWNDLEDGNNTIEIRVFDTASNQNVTIDTVYVLKDTIPPIAELNTLKYGWFNSDPGNIIDIDFSNNGTGSDLDYAEYRINSGVWQKISDIDDASYNTDWGIDWLQLKEGENIIDVRIWDIAGLSSTQIFYFCKDTTEPEIIVNQGSYGWYSSDPAGVMDIDFLCTQAYIPGTSPCSILDFAEYKIGVDGTWTRIFDGNTGEYITPWSLNWSLLEDGVNDIYLRTCDLALNLNESTTPVKFMKDTIAPSIIINQDIYGWYKSDPDKVIDVDFSHLPEGDSSAFDPLDHSTLSKAQYQIMGTNIWVDIFNEQCNTFTNTWNVSWEDLQQGKNVIHIRVFDIVGNMYYDSAKNITILKDTQEPFIFINQIEYGWYNKDPGAVIDVDFLAASFEPDFEINSPLQKAQYKVGVYGAWLDIFDLDDSQAYNYSGDWSVPWDRTSDGLNYIFVRVYDSAGNLYEPSIQLVFKRDTIGPKAPTLLSPMDGTKTIDNTPRYKWDEAIDLGSNVTAKYKIEIDTTETFSISFVSNEISSLTFSHDSTMPLGEYYWRVQGIDAAGNYGSWSEVWSFEVVASTSSEANLPPIADAGDDVVAGLAEVVWFDAMASVDPENDPMTFLWYISGNPAPDADGVLVNWVFTEMGVYDVELVVFDDHGGSDSDSVTVEVLDTNEDSDSDGIPDAWEEFYGLDPHDPSDALEDLDNDGYINRLEYEKQSSLDNLYSTPRSVDDVTPPNIVHTKVIKGNLLKGIEITAIVTDSESGIKEVNLYYKKMTEDAYNSISMGNDNPYSATIPGSIATLDDVEYYIEAIDNAKLSNIAFFGSKGETDTRPMHTNDIDVDIREDYYAPDDSNKMDEIVDTFGFTSLEVCLMVFIMAIIIIISLSLSVRGAVRAKQQAALQKQLRTIRVAHGKNMVWEGFELENISEDEDLNLIEDNFRIDEI